MSNWKVTGGQVVVLLMDKLLSVEVSNDESVLKLSWDDPMLLFEEGELSVSSVVQGVVIEFVLRFIRCVHS